jgi:hypothetical protein
MKKIVRWLLKTLLIVVAVLFVLAVALVLFLGPIIKTAAEKIGPKVLGVSVTVEKVKVNVFDGSFGLKGLRVGNPAGKGFSTDPAFSLGELRVAVKLGSLPGKGPIEVKEVTILEPKVSYEVVKAESNIDALLKNMQGGKPAPAGVQSKTAEKKEARKVIIDRFEFRRGELSYRAGFTLGKAINVPLLPIVATDIGKSSNGTSTEEALNRMFLEMVSGVGKAVVSVPGAIGDLGKGAVGGAQNAGSAVQDAGKGALNKIESIF